MSEMKQTAQVLAFQRKQRPEAPRLATRHVDAARVYPEIPSWGADEAGMHEQLVDTVDVMLTLRQIRFLGDLWRAGLIAEMDPEAWATPEDWVDQRGGTLYCWGDVMTDGDGGSTHDDIHYSMMLELEQANMIVVDEAGTARVTGFGQVAYRMAMELIKTGDVR